MYVTAANVNVIGNICHRNQNIAFTSSLLRYISGARGSISGNTGTGLGTGSSRFCLNDVDSGVTVVNNVIDDWSVQTATGALTKTIVNQNISTGTNSNKEEFTGYFSGDATTTVNLPTGWSVSRIAAGNYSLTHSLSLASVYDIAVLPIPDSTGDDTAQADYANSTTTAARIRTKTAGAAADVNVVFSIKRRR